MLEVLAKRLITIDVEVEFTTDAMPKRTVT